MPVYIGQRFYKARPVRKDGNTLRALSLLQAAGYDPLSVLIVSARTVLGMLRKRSDQVSSCVAGKGKCFKL